jgi:hypothetical protein
MPAENKPIVGGLYKREGYEGALYLAIAGTSGKDIQIVLLRRDRDQNYPAPVLCGPGFIDAAGEWKAKGEMTLLCNMNDVLKNITI